MPSLPALPVCSGRCPQTITAPQLYTGQGLSHTLGYPAPGRPQPFARLSAKCFSLGTVDSENPAQKQSGTDSTQCPDSVGEACWWTHSFITGGPGWGCFTDFPLPVWALNLFPASSVGCNLLAVSQQGLCSQLTGTAVLPASLPGQNLFVEHSSGQVQQGWLACAHLLLLDFSLKALWLIFCCYFQRRLNMP